MPDHAPDHSPDPTPAALPDLTLGGALDAIAARSPTPGGGATAALAGALAAAQAEMVVAYSIGKPALAEHQPALRDARDRLVRARALFLELAEEDAAAFSLLSTLGRLGAGDAPRAELPTAAAAAARIPLACVANATALVRLCLALAPISNRQLSSDLAIAAILAESAARAGARNVLVNLPTLAEHAGAEIADSAGHDLDRLLADAASLLARALDAIG